MFDLEKFNAMLCRHHTSKRDVSKYLGISIASLYRRLQKGGEFTTTEIRLLINFYGKEEVLDCLFSCD